MPNASAFRQSNIRSGTEVLRTLFSDIREFTAPGIRSVLHEARCPDCFGLIPVVLRPSGEVFGKCLRNGRPHPKLQALLIAANTEEAIAARLRNVPSQHRSLHIDDDDGGGEHDCNNTTPYTTSLREMIANPEMLAPPPAVVSRLAWRGRSTLLVAREKLGKSTYGTAAAAAVSAGIPFLDATTEQGSVFWIGTDEAAGDAVRRFVAFGANPDNIHLLTRRPPPEEIVEKVRAEVERLHPVLVVIDTLPTFVSGLVADYNDATGYTPVLADLTQIARDFNCALVMIHHAKKEGSEYRDSTAIGGAVDMILTMTGKADESKRHLAALGRFTLDSYTVRLDGVRYLISGSGEDTLEIRILDWLRRNPNGSSTKAVSDGVGANKRQVQLTLEHLGFTGLAFDAGDSSSHLWKLAAVEPDPALWRPLEQE